MTGVGINIIGYASGNLGLGVTARDLGRLLLRRGHPIAVFDLDAGLGRSGLDDTLAQHTVSSIDRLPYLITIWVIGADSLAPSALQILETPVLRDGRFNVAYVWWELPDVPKVWQTAAQAFDALLTGSEFVREVWANNVSHTPVLLAGTPIEIPRSIQADRPRFGLQEGRFYAFTGFEPASDPVRKNPFATVSAFKLAFEARTDAGLVIKLNNARSSGAESEVRRLRTTIAGDERITVLEERLAYDDLLCLYASCDVIMSLHRSEGLGLVPLEAMAVGRPVLATGWSGNMTYMDQTNAALIRYALIPVDKTSQSYAQSVIGVQSKWAEPDVDHAAEWLRVLASDKQLALDLGRRARSEVIARNERLSNARFLDELQAILKFRRVRTEAEYRDLRDRVSNEWHRFWLQRQSPADRALRSLRGLVDRHFRLRFRWTER